MQDRRPSPLEYESKKDFKHRRRFLVLTDLHWEGIRFALWMFGFLVAGLALGLLFYYLQ